MAVSKKSEAETSAKSAPKKSAAAKTATAKVPTPAKAAAKKAAAPKTAAKKASKKSVVGSISAEERYRMTEVAAYFIAERNHFAGHPIDYWAEAEKQVSAMLDGK